MEDINKNESPKIETASTALIAYEKFIDWLFSSDSISVPNEFHDRCNAIQELLDNDISGTINSLLDYSIDSASEAKYKIECENNTLEKLLNMWLERINQSVSGVPTGLQALAKEYHRERKTSSFCILRVKEWQTITADGVSIKVPTVMWFPNGASIYVKRPNTKNYRLGSDTYFLDKEEKIAIPSSKEEEIIIQKPFNRWFEKYPSPYLIRKGTYKNWLGMKVLQEKGDEVISKILPYLFVIKATLAAGQGNDALKGLVDALKPILQNYKSEKDKVPTSSISKDQTYEHLIPDFRHVVTEELYRQGYRAILSSLGFIDVIQGVSSTRKESVLNPKPFIAEINSSVNGFKGILLDVIALIRQNNVNHKKLFAENKRLMIVNSPLKINTESILDTIRSGFVYGAVGYQTFLECLGFDAQEELQRAEKEWRGDYRTKFYPHAITNVEDKGIDTVIPTTKKQTEKQKEKEEQPENMQTANLFREGTEVTLLPGKYERAHELVNEKKWVRDGFTTFSEEQKGYVFNAEFNVIRCGLDGYYFAKKENVKINQSPIDPNLKTIAKCSKCGHEFDYLAEPEAGMGYVLCPKCKEAVTQKDLIIAPYDKSNPPDFLKKYPKGAQDVFIEVFNKNLPKGEDYAFPIAWTALKRWMKKHGYKKVKNEWVKSEETK